MDLDSGFFGGATKKYYSDIGEVVSFIPRYHTSGGGFRNEYFPRRRLGYGWGSTILSFFKPFLKKGLHAVVNVASKVASDAIEGQNVKESLKQHGLTGISNLLQNKQPEVETLSSPIQVKQPKRVTPATARKKSKVIIRKTSRGSSGSGKKQSGKKYFKKINKAVNLKKKFPILEYM